MYNSQFYKQLNFKMMNKTKNLFLAMSLLAIAGLWTACSNDQLIETPDGKQPISFRVQGGLPELRTTSTTLSQVDAFVVYGFERGTDGIPLILFDGVTVARQAGNSDVFDYYPKKFYLEDTWSATFFAYSPVSKNVQIVTAPSCSGEVTRFYYEVDAPNASGDTAQEDLLVEYMVLGHPVPGSPPLGTNVSLAFQHVLSRVFVKATNNLSEIVIIRGLTLKNLYSKGQLGGWGDLYLWDVHSEKKDYSYILAPSGVAVEKGLATPTLVTSMEQGMMVLPQKTVNTGNPNAFDPGDFALEVTYDIANLKNQTAHVMLPNNYEFEPGKQYAINIDFAGLVTLVEISFTITVTDFETPIIEVP